MEIFFKNLNELDNLGLDNVRVNQSEVLLDKSLSVDYVRVMRTPFWYRKNRRLTLKSSEEIEIKLDDESKKRFYFFMRPPVGKYLKIIDTLEEMKKSPLAKGGSRYQKVLIALVVMMFFSFLASPALSFFFLLIVGYLIYSKGLGRKVNGLMEAINEKINSTKKIALREEKADYKDITDLLHTQVHEKIYNKAKHSCSIEESDIIGNNGKAIILQEFAFLQLPELSGYSKMDKDYIDTYWSTASGDLVSSCYYLQYIFMLEDKIETYSTFYDLILDKQVGKDVQSFYYSDISKISEVEEDIGLFGITKFEIAINSGDKIQINLKNQNTIDEMSEKPKDSDNEKSIQAEITELEKELTQTNNTEGKEHIISEIKELKGQIKNISFNDSMINTVESFAKSLKASVNNRKNA